MIQIFFADDYIDHNLGRAITRAHEFRRQPDGFQFLTTDLDGCVEETGSLSSCLTITSA